MDARAGLRWHTQVEMEERGVEAVIDEAIAQALDGPDRIYLSVDIDVVDPGMAPGTGTPESGGMLGRELLRAVRRIAGAVDLAGMDVVEVSPPYDHAEITAMLAGNVVMEALSALAAARAEGPSRGTSGHVSKHQASTRTARSGVRQRGRDPGGRATVRAQGERLRDAVVPARRGVRSGRGRGD